MSTVDVVTDDDFDEVVLSSERPVVVDFWADWCVPCVALTEVIDQLAVEFGERVRFVKLDVARNRRTAKRYEVNNLPALFLFRGGEICDSLIGTQPKEAIRRAVESMSPSG